MTGFRRVRGWGEGPREWERGEVAGVAVDPSDRVYLLVRADPPVRVFERDGTALAAWGTGLFKRPHGISVGTGGAVYCVDDAGHAVHKCSPAGEVELTLTRLGDESDYDPLVGPGRPQPVTRVAPPFNYPTHAVEAPSGELYVSDGYGNARVHVFTAAGELVSSWGAPGSAPGEFDLPHGLAWDARGRLYVSDRLNSRVQIFAPDGSFLEEWPARRPNGVAFDADGDAYVAELGSVFLFTESPDLGAERARISVRGADGEVRAELTASEDGDDAIYFAPHAVAVDRQGDLYVGEVPASYSRGTAPRDASVLRKYVRA